MAQYTITTLPDHELALACILAPLNAAVDVKNAANPNEPAVPHVTPTDYITARVKEVLDSWGNQFASTLLATALAKYADADSTQRTQVLTALGMAAYVGLPLPQQLEVLRFKAVDAFKALDPTTKTAILTALGML